MPFLSDHLGASYFGSATSYSVSDIGHETVKAGLRCRVIACQFLFYMRSSPSVIWIVLFRVSSASNAWWIYAQIGPFYHLRIDLVAHISSAGSPFSTAPFEYSFCGRFFILFLLKSRVFICSERVR